MNTNRISKPTALFSSLAILAGAFAIAGLMTAPTSAMSEKHNDRVGSATDALCSQAAWPRVSQACLEWNGGTVTKRKQVRVVTFETRDEANRTSTLVKMPVTVVATR